MEMYFTKMQGLGNDFILMDYIDGLDYSKLSKKMCDRHFGIGADGLIVVNPSDMQTSDTDISWHIYNSDGTEPQMCGNGIRCLAKYAKDRALVDKNKFSVNTLKGIVEPEILNNGEIRVNMGTPILKKDKIPFLGSENLNFSIELDNNCFLANAISMGNPHCVIFVDNDTKMFAEIFGREIENNPNFPEKTNVEFVRILSRNEINMDVWERGCGITLACGTGSCASVVAGILNDLLDNKVKVNLAGGSLLIEWDGNQDSPVYMTGEAKTVFSGVWHEE